jgi:hypothetical protein
LDFAITTSEVQVNALLVVSSSPSFFLCMRFLDGMGKVVNSQQIAQVFVVGLCCQACVIHKNLLTLILVLGFFIRYSYYLLLPLLCRDSPAHHQKQQ